MLFESLESRTLMSVSAIDTQVAADRLKIREDLITFQTDCLAKTAALLADCKALKADGKDVTRANFVKTLLTTTFSNPATTPLKYSATNHQGLTGGVIAKIAANGTAAPVKALLTNSTVFTTGNSASSPITTTNHLTISPIPAWLK